MQVPGPVRAFVGLIAAAAEEARQLPDRAVELPMLAVSSALQMSVRAQQRYARLAARGEEVLNRRSPTDEAPPWATFDAPVGTDELAAAEALTEKPASARKAAPAKKATAKRSSSSGNRPAKKVTAAKKASGSKTVNAPRHTSPSRFDTVDDS